MGLGLPAFAAFTSEKSPFTANEYLHPQTPSLTMKLRGILYLILLSFSIVLKVITYSILPQGEFLDWIVYTGLIFDLIFYGISVSLLTMLKEQRWLVGLAWIALIASLVKDPLGNFSDEFIFLSPRQFTLYTYILSVPEGVLPIGLFFVRKSPLRPYFRWLFVLGITPFMLAGVDLISGAGNLRAGIIPWWVYIGITLIENILLFIIVLKTPRLRRPEYADFLKE